MTITNVTPKMMLDCAYSLAVGGGADINMGSAPEDVVKAAMAALVACVKELAVDMSDRFPVDSLSAAHAAAVDALDRDASRLNFKVSKPPPRVVMRREVERDAEGRIVALVDTRTD